MAAVLIALGPCRCQEIIEVVEALVAQNNNA
jgi:hypothetical protein